MHFCAPPPPARQEEETSISIAWRIVTCNMRPVAGRLLGRVSSLKAGKLHCVSEKEICNTEPKRSLCTWLGECCRQVEADEVCNSRIKIHQTMYKQFFRALYMLAKTINFMSEILSNISVKHYRMSNAKIAKSSCSTTSEIIVSKGLLNPWLPSKSGNQGTAAAFSKFERRLDGPCDKGFPIQTARLSTRSL